MEAQLVQPLSVPTQDYAESFFRQLPQDERFIQTSYQKFPPVSSITANKIEFVLSRFEAGNLYLLADACLEVACVIVKADGTLPATANIVGTCNNLLHSLFHSVRLVVNDKPITSSESHYPYKAYITHCLTFSAETKSCQLACQGYYSDLAGHFGPDSNNTGFNNRSQLFRVDGKKTNPYSGNGTRLFGKLLLDLASCPTGLPPGTKVKLELTKSDDAFVIMCPATDTEKYKIQFLDINLYVPVAQLSASVHREISSILTNRSIGLHFRKIEILPISLPPNKQEFNSDNLFVDDFPCRIVIVFVESAAKNGSQATNPFDFKRKWTVKVPKPPGFNTGVSKTQKERELELQLSVLQKQIDQLNALAGLFGDEVQEDGENAPLKKGKAKAKKNSTETEASQAGTSQSFLQRLRSLRSGTQLNEPNQTEEPEEDETASNATGASSFSAQTAPPPYSDVSADETKTIYIRKVELLLNGSPIDQVCMSMIQTREVGSHFLL